MAIKPFANAPHAHKGNIGAQWLIGVQVGQTPDAAGVAEMMYLTVSEFTGYIKSAYGAMWNYRGEFDEALPSDPANSDYFICTGTFTEDGVTYYVTRVYAYNGNTWDDVSLVFDQYAPMTVTDYDPTLAWGTRNVVAVIGSTPISVTMPAQPDWNASEPASNAILNKPELATVATTGSYNDLIDKPVAPSGAVTDVTATNVSIQVKTFDTATLHLGDDNVYSILELGTDVQLSFLVDGVEQQSVSLVSGINVTKST